MSLFFLLLFVYNMSNMSLYCMPCIICLKWLGLTLGRHASCEFLAFDVAHAYTPLIGSSVGLRMI